MCSSSGQATETDVTSHNVLCSQQFAGSVLKSVKILQLLVSACYFTSIDASKNIGALPDESKGKQVNHGQKLLYRESDWWGVGLVVQKARKQGTVC